MESKNTGGGGMGGEEGVTGRSWRGDKTAHCSPRGSEFSFQCPQLVAHKLQLQRIQCCLLGSLEMGTHLYRHIHT